MLEATTLIEPVHILSAGPFGKAAAQNLRALRTDCFETSADHGAALEAWPLARIHVVAAWRPMLELCERADAISHERGRPFIPLIMDSKTLSLGPVIVPGAGSCWRCWLRRSRQHDAWAQPRLALTQHYSEDPASGPRGYLEPFAMLGAARVAQTIDALDSLTPLGGQLWQIDLITRDITASTVIPIHGCSRCGLHRPSETRSFDQMRQALAYLWQS